MEIAKIFSVKVPVLSKTTWSTLEAFSKVSLVLIKIPFLAQSPKATTRASGVARPKAQGQAMTKTVTNLVREVLKEEFIIKERTNVRKDTIKTKGTK